MNKKRILGLVLAGAMAISAFAFAGCGDKPAPDAGGTTPDEGGSSMNTYKIEAEYCDLTNVVGAGISSDQKGVQMIHGDGTNKSWSEGYYLAHTHTTRFSLDFEFTADKAGTAVMFIYLGTDIQGKPKYTYTPADLEISINGVVAEYGEFVVPSTADMNSMKFVRCTISTNAAIKEGKNIVNIKVKDNKIKNGETGGALIDYLEVRTSSNLTPLQKKENIAERDGDGF